MGSTPRLDRARIHAENLKNLIDPAVRLDTKDFLREEDGDPTKLVYKIRQVPEMSPLWSLILGDYLTNARAALDYLAWQIALLDNAPTNNRTKFPIYDRNVDKNGRPSPAKINGVTRKDLAEAVESVQPYNVSRFKPDRSPLCILNRLVNIDKHQLLLTVAGALKLDGMWWGTYDGIAPDPSLNLKSLNDGNPVAWFDFKGTLPHPDFDPHLGIEICLKGRDIPVSAAGVDVRGVVAATFLAVEGVVANFSKFFGLPPRHTGAP